MIVGIDLGTSNCAVASVNPSDGDTAPIRDFPVRQEVRPGELAERPLLPSCLYLPLGETTWLVGESARWQGARVTSRLVSSAKSWLCHPGVDRQAPILPWGAPPEVARLSPVEASRRLLETLRSAWDAQHPDAPLANQEVVITVPASFDEVARALTVAAARQAGLLQFTLLEEPQAAFYDFTARHRSNLAQALRGVHSVLVVDVGGGTSDFTWVQVESLPEGPAMKRVAVGDHLMLGGDNMDAALAHHVEGRLGEKRLAASQWTQLVQAARTAKEALLSAPAPDQVTLAVAAAGSKLIAGSISAELRRDDVEALVVDGFFPQCGLHETPRQAARGAALSELGLPYAADAGITRHLAQFVAAHGARRPDALLLNGGVFNSPRLAAALVKVVSSWWPTEATIPLLPHHSLDLAVARGAAYYGLVRKGLGRRITGGAARAYYVELNGGQAVCLLPRGFEEGQTTELKERTFSLALGRPVQFELHSSSADRADTSGSLVALGDDFKALPPIHTVLQSAQPGSEARVHLRATLTEIGTLELWCVAADRDERWRLEFELRGASTRRGMHVTESMPARFGEAVEQVQRVFGHKPLPVGPKDVKNLVRSLEKTLGPKEEWRLPVLRELWGALYAGASKRRRSEDHERVFFQLLGFSLRPGFGYPLDDWRAAQTFKLFKEMVTHHLPKPVWTEFWVMWRRAAGGLDEAAQQELFAFLSTHLDPARKKQKGIQPEGHEEMVRTAAALEHVEPGQKEKLGDQLLARLLQPDTRGGPWAWSLGRLGARQPLYASSHRVVAAEVAARWVDALLARPLADDVPFAIVQLARRTGDRARDLDDETLRRASATLQAARVHPAWVSLLTEVVKLSAADEARALGDTLPQGLSL